MATSKKSIASVKQQKVEMKDEQTRPDDSEREQWIEEAAYFMSESRGFVPGYEQEDWNAAEKKYENNIAA